MPARELALGAFSEMGEYDDNDQGVVARNEAATAVYEKRANIVVFCAFLRFSRTSTSAHFSVDVEVRYPEAGAGDGQKLVTAFEAVVRLDGLSVS